MNNELDKQNPSHELAHVSTEEVYAQRASDEREQSDMAAKYWWTRCNAETRQLDASYRAMTGRKL